MTRFSHAGVGWPNGPADNEAIASLPTDSFLMLATEGRYHYDWLRQRRPDAQILWRAVPRIGKRPAELKWSSARFASEALNLTDEPGQPIRDFVFANELDLRDERGDDGDDWDDLEHRYGLIGGWGYSLVPLLRAGLPGARLHWPAFTPDHDALGHLYLWREAAEMCDVIDFHAYDTLENVQRAYDGYRSAFPDKPLALTEHHCKGDVEEERRVLQWLANTMQDDPLFLAAYRFIWEWFNYPGWWKPEYDVVHNSKMVALFQNPPIAVSEPSKPDDPPPSPEPEPQPEPAPPEEPPVPDYPLGIDVSNNNGSIDWAAVAASGVQFAIAKITEGTGFRDGYFADNWAGMRANGIIRGAYHFARPSRNPARAEADYFCDAFGLLGTQLEPGDLVALDLEDEQAAGDLSGWTLAWCQHVEERLGFKPLVYTSPAYATRHRLANRPELADYGLWCASWGVPTPPQAPPPWGLVAIHQFTVAPAGTIGGIGEVDLNRYNGSIETLPLYGMPAPAEPEPVPPAEPPAYSVGPGILAKMGETGDSPVTDEAYYGKEYSEAFGASGARYVYLAALGRTFRFDPSA